jgi:membrane protein DedA with SNARE-associated domain
MICFRSAADPKDRLSPTGRKLFNVIAQFNWTSILLKLCMLSELFFTFQVGVTKATYVFLSWLNEALVDVSLALVCVIVFVVGNLMFLLPPVPGLPVYIFGGILIGAKGQQEFGEGGIWWGCLIASFLCLCTKLVACTGQYMIGYFLGKSVKIQQLIAVDKVGTRAIERVLKSKGLNPYKVSILVGGPDWPTSVTCGIIGVNIPQMLIGTIPVASLLTPCVLAGACLGQVKPGEANMWQTAAQGFTAFAAAVNAASAAYAVYAVSKTLQKHGDELAKPRPEHAKVAELTRSEEAWVAKYNEVSKWSTLSVSWKGMLAVTTAFLYLSNFCFVVLEELAFRPFAVSSSIGDSYGNTGLEGKWYTVVRPVGVALLVVFFIGVILHLIFVHFMSKFTSAGLALAKSS